MNSKINMKLLFFLFSIIFLVLAIISIRTTYARYITSLTAGGSVELGTWLVLVNNQNVMENSDLSNTITPNFNIESSYIAEGKIAPTSTGYVEISLNYEEVSVPFKYDLSFTQDATTFLKDFKLISYSVDGGETITLDTTDDVITSTILPNETTRTRTLKLNFSWVDAGELTDAQDTLYSNTVDNLQMRFNIAFTQLQPITQ